MTGTGTTIRDTTTAAMKAGTTVTTVANMTHVLSAMKSMKAIITDASQKTTSAHILDGNTGSALAIRWLSQDIRALSMTDIGLLWPGRCRPAGATLTRFTLTTSMTATTCAARLIRGFGYRLTSCRTA